ncbi:uncharacterized protein L969DRAFT_17921 [Mixia osmundae IAM 14324]|uniref:uncharacterized protein n=1 Tax=Mixia osmundae (strain CBS 9802 / IAM 14324 / JCM 22182 / KY 12970) TaxID=764103 RepID=UPI0004A54E35|nr:uncharacterized protein L969DRAFT_17921 [Mixia osmundae IAM 14324]KEI38838.1 hypothetical protein L969DRAFT_17921 [Mixia osmundae IAM 14324]
MAILQLKAISAVALLALSVRAPPSQPDPRGYGTILHGEATCKFKDRNGRIMPLEYISNSTQVRVRVSPTQFRRNAGLSCVRMGRPPPAWAPFAVFKCHFLAQIDTLDGYRWVFTASCPARLWQSPLFPPLYTECCEAEYEVQVEAWYDRMQIKFEKGQISVKCRADGACSALFAEPVKLECEQRPFYV